MTEASQQSPGDALGHPAAADRAVEHALDLAECP